MKQDERRNTERRGLHVLSIKGFGCWPSAFIDATEEAFEH